MKKKNTDSTGSDTQLDDSFPGIGSNYGKDGVVVTLIRWMLSLSPLERLQVLQQHLNSINHLRKFGKFI